jgi:hypothetical protein
MVKPITICPVVNVKYGEEWYHGCDGNGF